MKKSIPKLEVGAYDPAVEQFSKKPNRSFDLVTSFDVLEHVERHSEYYRKRFRISHDKSGNSCSVLQKARRWIS